ncbi:MAG TPA: FAD-dependent oxidoreductase [Prolixibacteraceae bacterium]|nr:FAD-dependent oxidoreductase [Prolixibacteraceae bacterium]HCR92239.1 FAD-dependent oxidoreductase [Prolixibacteraceae bacterium]HCU62344.1 FAD-dependent oxidoreductase [Prolixibacteraceae bacterium]
MTKIARRTMLRTIGGISLGSFIPVLGKASTLDKKSGENIKTITTDILVIGGGTAGTIAAIQAARAGCSTILVENGSQLGGTTTTGGVSFPGLFHAWGKQVISGIGWELVSETVKLDDGQLPDFSIPTGRQHWKHQVHVNPFIYTMLAEEKCMQAGIQIRYYETPVSIRFKGDNWEVDTVGKGTRTKIVCKQLIDCTGNASVTSLAGFNVLREEETQPGTLMFRIEGYDMENIDLKLIREKYEEAVAKGELVKEEFRNIHSLLQSHGNNVQHIAGADSTTSETHTITNINGRSSLMKHLRFLRTLPGCEKTRLISMQPETGVRETYRIDGEYQITHEDYTSGKVFDDSICYSFYPIDLHDKNGVAPKHLQEGTVATIPLRALVPKNSRNLLVAGRCLSSDRLANSALRIQASCMAMGQVAGATASLAVKSRKSPVDVPVDDIKSILVHHGAIVP